MSGVNGTACARAAADLTGLVDRLGRTARLLERQGAMPVADFGGLSGDAYRRHVLASSATAADLASEVALLAGALSTLGRELDRAAGLRSLGHRVRAAEVEHAAQSAWRDAVARFEGRGGPPAAVPPQPLVGGLPLSPSPPDPPSCAGAPALPAAASSPGVALDDAAPPGGTAVAPKPEPPVSGGPALESALESAFVVPGLPPGLDAAFEPSRREQGDG